MKEFIIIALAILVMNAATVLCAFGAQYDCTKKQEQRILDEILPQYEWEAYAYEIRELTKAPSDGKAYYIATFYTDQGKFEFLCAVTKDDVDVELL